MKRKDLRYFNRKDRYEVVRRTMPHWMQSGVPCFHTWRTSDSLPAKVLHRLDDELGIILRREQLDPNHDWRRALQRQPAAIRSRVRWKLFATRDKYLDAGYGRCLLAKPEHAQTVLDSLLRFDEDRYFLTDAVVMPNHVHFIAAFRSEEQVLSQCREWKRYIARTINAAENLKGEFWQVEQFDHLIRSEEHFESLRRYIAQNPLQAGLKPNEYIHYTKRL